MKREGGARGTSHKDTNRRRAISSGEKRGGGNEKNTIIQTGKQDERAEKHALTSESDTKLKMESYYTGTTLRGTCLNKVTSA